MLKESTQVVRHYRMMEKLFNVKRGIVWSIALMLLLGTMINVNTFFRGMFYGVAGVAIGETLFAFVCACIKEYLESTSIQLRNSEKIKDLSSDELLEILRMDKMVHNEVMESYTDEVDKDCEMHRYIGIRTAHFAMWYARNMDKVSTFCKSSEYQDEGLVEKFKKEQSECFDFIAEMFSEGVAQTSLIRHGEKLVYEKLNSMRAFISE